MRIHKLSTLVTVCLALSTLLATTALARDPFRSEPPAPQSTSVNLAEFESVVMNHVSIDPRYAGKGANQKARSKLDELLFTKMRHVFTDLQEGNVQESEAGVAPRTLRIEPHITAMKFVSGKARFWGGAMAGNSGVRLRVTLRDVGTDEIIGEAEFLRRANAFAGSASVGRADRSMLAKICDLAVDYVKTNIRPEVAAAR